MPGEIRDAIVIFNPRAGRAKRAGAGALQRVQAILAEAGIASELAPTDGPGSASELARQAVSAGRQMVIACGGDGTLNEVVNGMACSQVPLALLPAGTANILAKELRIPWNVESAAKLLVRGRTQRVALGLLTMERAAIPKRYFLSVAGAGLDGAMVQAVNGKLKHHTGILAYWAEGLHQFASYNFPRFRVTAGGETREATLIVVGRTKNYGGPFQITTEADLYGNHFELLICTTGSRWKYLSYVPMLWAGRLRKARDAHFVKATSVRCEPLDSGPAWLQVDGELAGSLPAEFRIVPDALTLVIPEQS